MNALPVLGEIKQAIKDLLEKGEPYLIYSNKMPTTLEDRYFLQDVLGKGRWFMYEKVLHTKAVAFNTLIPGVWIELIFSDKDPKEPILEMVRVDYSPLNFTMPKEDLEVGFKKFAEEVRALKGVLHPFAEELVRAFEDYLKTGKGVSFENPEGLENLTYYLLTDDTIVIEDKKDGGEITSTIYYGIWLEKDRNKNYRAVHIGNFPQPLKPTEEDLKRAITLIEERKKHFLPKYQNKADIPLL